MSDFDRNYAAARTGYRTDQVAIDAGLRAYMIRVYNYMAAGVALTGVVAWLTFSAAVVQTGAGLQLTAFGQAVFQSPLMWVLVLAPLGLVFAIAAGTLAAYFVVSGIMEFPYQWVPAAAIEATAAALAVTMVVGLAGTFGALSRKPAEVLRNL